LATFVVQNLREDGCKIEKNNEITLPSFVYRISRREANVEESVGDVLQIHFDISNRHKNEIIVNDRNIVNIYLNNEMKAMARYCLFVI
jgi:hypothetical protein